MRPGCSAVLMRPTVRILTVPSQRAADERLQKTRTRIWPAYGLLNCTRARRSTRSRRRAAGELIPEDGVVRLGGGTTPAVPGAPPGVGPGAPGGPGGRGGAGGAGAPRRAVRAAGAGGAVLAVGRRRRRADAE